MVDLDTMDFTIANDYLGRCNYPYILKANRGDFVSFKAFYASNKYSGTNLDENVEVAYMYALYINTLVENATGYIPAFLQKLANSKFTTNAGEGLNQT